MNIIYADHNIYQYYIGYLIGYLYKIGHGEYEDKDKFAEFLENFLDFLEGI